MKLTLTRSNTLNTLFTLVALMGALTAATPYPANADSMVSLGLPLPLANTLIKTAPTGAMSTLVAHTSEGQIVNGPEGLQLVNSFGSLPVFATPKGYVVKHPYPHLLRLTSR